MRFNLAIWKRDPLEHWFGLSFVAVNQSRKEITGVFWWDRLEMWRSSAQYLESQNQPGSDWYQCRGWWALSVWWWPQWTTHDDCQELLCPINRFLVCSASVSIVRIGNLAIGHFSMSRSFFLLDSSSRPRDLNQSDSVLVCLTHT